MLTYVDSVKRHSSFELGDWIEFEIRTEFYRRCGQTDHQCAAANPLEQRVKHRSCCTVYLWMFAIKPLYMFLFKWTEACHHSALTNRHVHSAWNLNPTLIVSFYILLYLIVNNRTKERNLKSGRLNYNFIKETNWSKHHRPNRYCKIYLRMFYSVETGKYLLKGNSIKNQFALTLTLTCTAWNRKATACCICAYPNAQCQQQKGLKELEQIRRSIHALTFAHEQPVKPRKLLIFIVTLFV